MFRIIHFVVICLLMHLIEYVVCDTYEVKNGTKRSDILKDVVAEMEAEQKYGKYNETLMKIPYNRPHKNRIRRGLNTNFPGRLIFYLVFDVSESIKETNLRKSVEFAKAIVRKVGISKNGARAGALTFSSAAETQFLPFTYETTEDVLTALNELNLEGGGSVSRSVLTLIREKDIPLSERIFSTKEMGMGRCYVIFIFTDGKSNMGENPNEEAEILKQAGVEIYCIGITNSVQEASLNAMASEPKAEHLFILGNYANISYLIEEIAGRTSDSNHLDDSTKISNPLQEADIKKDPQLERNLEKHYETKINRTKTHFHERRVFYLVFDVSENIGEIYFRKSIEFAKAFVMKVGISKNGTRFGALTFSSTAETLFLPFVYETTEDVLVALNELNFIGGGSATRTVLTLIREKDIPLTQRMFSTKEMRSVIFIFTDGESNTSDNLIEEAENLKHAGVEIYCIGITNSVQQASLNAMASEPKAEHLFILESYANISYLVEEITNSTSDSYYPNNGTDIKNNLQKTDIEKEPVKEQNLTETRWNGAKYISFSNYPGRLVFYFIFDVSGSIEEVNFKKSVEFAKIFVRKVGISKNGARAGAVLFSSRAESQFLPLNFETTDDVLAALDELSFTGGGSAPKSAFSLIREEHIPITEAHLPKKGMKSIIFIFTDGKVNRGGDPNEEAGLLKQAGVEIFSIGVTLSVLRESLYKMASEPKEKHVFILENYASMSYLIEETSDVITNSFYLENNTKIGEQEENLEEHQISESETKQNRTKDISLRNFPGRPVFYFLFDASGSVREVNFRKSVEFAKAFGKKVGISENGARAGAVLFSTRAESQFLPLNFETTDGVLAVLDKLNFTGGRSAPGLAFALIREEQIPITQSFLSKKGMKSIIFIFTDGKANQGGDPNEEAELLKHAGVEIFCIGITTSVLRESLNKMASEPKEKHVFNLENYTNTSYLIEEIITNSYHLQNSTKIGAKEENMEEHQIPESEIGRNGTKDISFSNFPGRPVFYFVFDVSRRIRERNFWKTVGFVKAFVKKVGISKNGTRAGVLTFSSTAETIFLPFVYETTEDVLADLDELSLTGRESDPNSALALIREEHIPLTEYHLSKKGMKSIIFIFTDGKSNTGDDPNDEAELLKRKGVEIYCIGVTKSVHNASLNKLASEPKEERVFNLKDYSAVSNLIEKIIDTLVNYSTCGRYPRKSGNDVGQGKVVGGRKIVDPWPWMAALYTFRQDLPPEFLCGGSVIHERFILTAAHCLYTNDRRPREEMEILVKLGLTNVRNQSSLQESEVQKIIFHPNYRSGPVFDYDIALLELETPIKFNSLIRPICLPPRELLHYTSFYKTGEYVVAIGWGVTRIVRIMEQIDYQPSDTLKEIMLPIQSRERCRSREAFYFLLRESVFTDRMFCAGDGKGGNDTCPGDSGGPVMQSWLNEDGDTYWTQVGIVSWGLGCGLARTYGYYTHVHKLVDWVISNISPKN